jgi:hypothetical protein
MPLAAAIPGIIGAVGAIGGGALAGASNTRPPSLDQTQSGALDSLIKNLLPQTYGAPKIDPAQQASMFDEIAKSGVGGANRITNALSSRGLGRSGLLASGLTQNSNQIAGAQTGANLQLQQQAISQRNTTIQQLMGLLGVSNIPGQSTLGGASAGAAPLLSYFLSKAGAGFPSLGVPNTTPTVSSPI